MQVTHFEFSNESYLKAHSSYALAAQYAYAVAQWAPQLKAILPNMKLGANGLSSYDSVGAQDMAQQTGVKWWSTVRASHMVPQAYAHQSVNIRSLTYKFRRCTRGLHGRLLATVAKQ